MSENEQKAGCCEICDAPIGADSDLCVHCSAMEQAQLETERDDD